MRLQANDTPLEVERILIDAYRQMSPAEKLQKVCSLNATLRQLQLGQVRAAAGQDVSERELRLRVAARTFDRDVMIRAFAWDPEIQGR